MVSKPPGRNRPVNVAVAPFLSDFIRQLADATNWGRSSEVVCCTSGRVLPGSPLRSWRGGSPDRLAVDYLWEELLSKYDDGKPSPEKEENTWSRFKEAEELCAQTNQRILHPDPAVFSTSATGAISLFEGVRQKIQNVLGAFDWNECRDRMVFTSGASTRLPKREGQPVYKYSGKPETTYDNLALAQACIRSVPLWEQGLLSDGSLELSICSGNKIERVAKNYKTDRTIAIEPDMNMYVQKGIGNLLRQRLRYAGMDLSTQQTNQDLALLGSKTGLVATIDMSMASDTVSLELVRALLPPDWLSALEQCRSAIGILPSGDKILYRKFSSMGNGYTFELESLIFWAIGKTLCRAYGCSDALVSVHGDDLIVPSTVAPMVVEFLNYCGFKTNDKKTFVRGNFRESCGKHYFHGHDITPFYIKAEPKRLLDLFLLHNKLYRWVVRQRLNRWVDHAKLRALLNWLRRKAPANWRRPRIPNGMGDGAFIGTFDECLPSKPANTYKPNKVGKRDGWEGWLVDVLCEVADTASFDESRLCVVRKNELVLLKQRSPDPWAWLLTHVEPRCVQPLDYLEGASTGRGLSLAPRTRVIQMLVPHFDWR